MKPGRYTALLKFFRSNAFDLDILYRKLITVLLKILPPKTIDGKVILVGDHIKIAKEGRRMPAIEKLLASPGLAMQASIQAAKTS